MKDIVTPVTPEEVKIVIRKCLENAALVNYTRISQKQKVEGVLIIYFQEQGEMLLKTTPLI